MKYPINKLKISDEKYPKYLSEITKPPELLYYRGNLKALAYPLLAVVGTRAASSYGKTITLSLITSLTQAGLGIVSGLALGIDSVAHWATVEAGGKTIAILPGGLLDTELYPRSHVRLARRILDTGGLLLSEYNSHSVRKYHFLERNRIIAGLCAGTLVIECGVKSGALITANHALAESRTVYAIPGQINTNNSAGTNELIKHGATLVTDPQDILKDYNLIHQRTKRLPTDPQQQQMVQYITQGMTTVNDLANICPWPTHITLALLTNLELNGYIIKRNQHYTLPS